MHIRLSLCIIKACSLGSVVKAKCCLPQHTRYNPCMDSCVVDADKPSKLLYFLALCHCSCVREQVNLRVKYTCTTNRFSCSTWVYSSGWMSSMYGLPTRSCGSNPAEDHEVCSLSSQRAENDYTYPVNLRRTRIRISMWAF
jgi:hypothetical protein